MSIFDMLLANAMGESGGGGGSSDISTAQVTVTFEGEWCPLVASFVSVDSETSNTYIGDTFHSGDVAAVILYKGSAIVYCNNGYITSTSGAIQDIGDYFYRITGDCTIGITGDT